ncbi:MAG: hypothetical protein FRX48_04774 [Lasallia pustulata]|uniref:Uncharacterized protein n=1 Tax=Lasallia pustulata TaxID=136370 RepID=A0A5M8PPR8_9LECA|nr:MAG: hypothetical protein FRX48_04774 [Lasallia pustulata]
MLNNFVRVSTIRHALLRTVPRRNTFLSTSTHPNRITAAQSRNGDTNHGHFQYTHQQKHTLPQLAAKVWLKPFRIPALSRIYKSQSSDSPVEELKSWTLQSPQLLARKRLFEAFQSAKDIDHLREIISTRVLSHQDGVELLSASVALINALKKLRSPSTEGRVLCAFTATIARLHRLGVEPNEALIIFGIWCAARARSFEALARYLNIATSNSHRLGGRLLYSLLKGLHGYLPICDREVYQGLNGRRRKQQALRILTGWQFDGVRRPDEKRQPCLFMAMPRSDLSLWKSYVSLLRGVGGKDVIFSEWSNFKRSLPGLANPVKDHSATTKSSGTVDLGDAIAIAGTFARSLILVDDAERAWQVIHDCGSELGAVSDETWSMLLDYPQHIRSWQPAMAEKVLKKYEECVNKIEAAMGIAWVGGEDGYHIASIQGETAEELDDLEELGEGMDRVNMLAKASSCVS